jgi:hypothetical protein
LYSKPLLVEYFIDAALRLTGKRKMLKLTD